MITCADRWGCDNKSGRRTTCNKLNNFRSFRSSSQMSTSSFNAKTHFSNRRISASLETEWCRWTEQFHVSGSQESALSIHHVSWVLREWMDSRRDSTMLRPPGKSLRSHAVLCCRSNRKQAHGFRICQPAACSRTPCRKRLQHPGG